MRKWEMGYDEGDGTPVVTCEARDICRVETHYGDAEVHARLIAAAPDLLEACEIMLAAYDTKGQAFPSAGENHAVRQAVAKAKGNDDA